MISTVSEFPTLTGCQEPTSSSVFDGDEHQGRRAMELSGRVGRRSFPWQAFTLVAMLRMTGALWTHPDVVLIVPRQNGKTLILVLRILFGLFVLNERIVYTAQRWKTAEDTYGRLWAIIRVRRSLNKRVVKNTCSQGNGYIEVAGGGRVLFCTRSADAGRGLDEVDLVIYDEAYNLTEAETSALNPTQLASANPQTIYTSSPVNQDIHPNGHVLTALRNQGLACEAGLLFMEWAATPDMPRTAEETWRRVNPSYGVIQTAAKVRKLLRTATTAAGRKAFDVEVLGIGDWPVPVDEMPSLIPVEVWEAMKNPHPVLVGSISLGLDMTPDRSRLAIVAAQWTTAGRVHLDLGYWAAPGPLVLPYLAGLVARWDPVCVVIDRNSPAFSYVDDLLNLGIEATVTGTAEHAAACGGFYDDSIGTRLGHTGDPDLADAVDGATKKQLPGGGWVWERLGPHPIAPVTAASGARWGLIKFGSRVHIRHELQLVNERPVAARSETADLATAGF